MDIRSLPQWLPTLTTQPSYLALKISSQTFLILGWQAGFFSHLAFTWVLRNWTPMLIIVNWVLLQKKKNISAVPVSFWKLRECPWQVANHRSRITWDFFLFFKKCSCHTIMRHAIDIHLTDLYSLYLRCRQTVYVLYERLSSEPESQNELF